MNKKFEANVRWLSPNEGGRSVLLTGDSYCPIIKIQRQDKDIYYTWSVHIKHQKIISEFESIVVIYYFADQAPNDLNEGTKFSLFEGNKIVGIGRILKLIG